MPTVDILIQPVVLRFSLSGDEIVYHFASGADAQLDRMELLLGVDPSRHSPFDSNVGFLPVASTVLIRGDKNIIVDPGNHHTGFYGQLKLALSAHGLTLEDIDIVVVTHSHHDHFASAAFFNGKELVLGAGELDYARAGIGSPATEVVTSRYLSIVEVPLDGAIDIAQGVRVISTPGHTPGHVVVQVDTEADRYLITGDAAMTRREFEDEELSHWYPAEQRDEMLASLKKMKALQPSIIIPGHDRAFRVTAGT